MLGTKGVIIPKRFHSCHLRLKDVDGIVKHVCPDGVSLTGLPKGNVELTQQLIKGRGWFDHLPIPLLLDVLQVDDTNHRRLVRLRRMRPHVMYGVVEGFDFDPSEAFVRRLMHQPHGHLLHETVAFIVGAR